jgi:hypothetical protein
MANILIEAGVRPYDVAVSPSVVFGMGERSFDVASRAICERRNEFHLLFVHADFGGRALQQNVTERREALVQAAVELCGFNEATAVYLSPLRELESWAIADKTAVELAFGVSRLPADLLPSDPRAAERHADPKSVLRAIGQHVGRRRPENAGILVRIAQEQRLEVLRSATSFQSFEEGLRSSLHDIGCFR